MDGMGMGIGMGTTAAQAWYQDYQNKQQHERQKELMGIQAQNQERLNSGQLENQKKLWDATNVGAQMEHMKRAGLNPALMYGKGGGQGQTGVQGGSASGGQAGHAPFMGMGAMQMGAQLANIEAQTKLAEANARKADADATYTGGVGSTLAWTQANYYETLKLNTQQDTQLKKAQEGLTLKNVSVKNQELANMVQQWELTDAQFDDIVRHQALENMMLEISGKVGEENIKLIRQKVAESIDTIKIKQRANTIANSEVERKKQRDIWEKDIATQLKSIKQNMYLMYKDLGQKQINQKYWQMGVDNGTKIITELMGMLNPFKSATNWIKESFTDKETGVKTEKMKYD